MRLRLGLLGLNHSNHECIQSYLFELSTGIHNSMALNTQRRASIATLEEGTNGLAAAICSARHYVLTAGSNICVFESFKTLRGVEYAEWWLGYEHREKKLVRKQNFGPNAFNDWVTDAKYALARETSAFVCHIQRLAECRGGRQMVW